MLEKIQSELAMRQAELARSQDKLRSLQHDLNVTQQLAIMLSGAINQLENLLQVEPVVVPQEVETPVELEKDLEVTPD